MHSYARDYTKTRTKESKLFYRCSLIFIRQIQLDEQYSRRKNQLDFIVCSVAQNQWNRAVYMNFTIIIETVGNCVEMSDGRQKKSNVKHFLKILGLRTVQLKVVSPKIAEIHYKSQKPNNNRWFRIHLYFIVPQVFGCECYTIFTLFIIFNMYFPNKNQKWNNSIEMKNHREIRNENGGGVVRRSTSTKM